VAFRGATDSVDLADWLIRKLDLPAKAPLSSSAQAKSPGRPDANANLYRLAAQQRDGSEDLARVFYVSPAVSVRGIQEMITAMRKDARIQKVFRIPRRPQSLCAEIQPNSPRLSASSRKRNCQTNVFSDTFGFENPAAPYGRTAWRTIDS